MVRKADSTLLRKASGAGGAEEEFGGGTGSLIKDRGEGDRLGEGVVGPSELDAASLLALPLLLTLTLDEELTVESLLKARLARLFVGGVVGPLLVSSLKDEDDALFGESELLSF